MEDFRFQVNLGGMIEILSDHLYSSPDVYIRELLQNAVDAISARRRYDVQEAAKGEDVSGCRTKTEGLVTLEINEGKRLVFTDNGQGLSEEEIHRFLAVIGESSKRNSPNGAIQTDYIGRFGIGLLSCFMVSDGICMVTKSCKSADAPVLCWRGKPDGTYTIEEIKNEKQEKGDIRMWLDTPGTKVILDAKPDMEHYFTREVIVKLVTYYGLLLPFSVLIRNNGEEKQINPTYLPWEGRETNRNELLLFGQMLFGEIFFDCVPFQSKAGNVSGVAYILNYTVQPSAKMHHRIYLKNMLLTEKGDNLIPDWAVFTRCIVNATDLRPTASREGFYTDAALEEARSDIEASLMSYITELAERQPARFEHFFSLHRLTLMSLALETSKLFETLIDYFEFVTTRGVMTGYQLKMCSEPLLYTLSGEKYRQLSQMFFVKDKLLINASYVYAQELLERLGEEKGLEVGPVGEWDAEDLMQELTLAEQDEAFDFEKRVNRILRQYDCQAEMKHFSPNNQPAFYLINEDEKIKRELAETRSQANEMFFQMLDTLSEEISEHASAKLYLNYSNPLVKKLVQVEKEEILKICVEILYVQAMQIGGYVLHNNELGLLNRGIMELMEGSLEHV